MKQGERTQIMNGFRRGSIDILVATDVAARGIDVEDIAAVFNYDIPQDVEYYVHRIGRTGRIGKEGRAFTFVTGRRQIYELRDIERFTKSKITLKAVPSSSEVNETNERKFLDRVRVVLEEGGLEEYTPYTDALLEDYASLDISAALIKMLLKKSSGAAGRAVRMTSCLLPRAGATEWSETRAAESAAAICAPTRHAVPPPPAG